MAYKGSGKKARIQGSGQKRSSYGKKPSTGFSGALGDLVGGSGRNSKKQSGSGGNSRKTHDTKGKNTHGRRSW